VKQQKQLSLVAEKNGLKVHLILINFLSFRYHTAATTCDLGGAGDIELIE
jgi:hypothetical protein